MFSLSLGNIAGGVISIITTLVFAILAFTLAPQVAGNISSIALEGKPEGYCHTSNENLDRVIQGTPGAKAADIERAWNSADTHTDVVIRGGECGVTGLEGAVYSPQGKILMLGPNTTGTPTPNAVISNGKWQPTREVLAAGALGGLIAILFGVMGILLPAGALGFVAYLGMQLARDNFGGTGMGVVIVALIGVVVLSSVFPQIIGPLDTFYQSMDGNRYYIFSTGIGSIASTLANFLGVVLIGGLIGIGAMVWRAGRTGGEA